MYQVIGYETSRRTGAPYPAMTINCHTFVDALKLCRLRNENSRKRNPYNAMTRDFSVIVTAGKNNADRHIRSER